METVKVMLRTLRGVEEIARAEVQARWADAPIDVEHRTLRLALPQLDEALLALGTVDDAFLVVAEGDGVGRARESLAALGALAAAIDGPTALAALQVVRPLAAPITFDVTGSFVGKRNFSRFEMEDAVGHALAGATGWTYEPRTAETPAGPTSLSVRAHALHESATLALRLGEHPLHRRAYRHDSRPGALHPPLARAMCLVADPPAGGLLVDPACGAGTIPIEAALGHPGVRTSGFDLDPDAVEATRANATRAGTALDARVADATSLPLDPGTVDRIVTNPPWGDTVLAGGGLRTGRAALWRELHRTLAADGRLVTLVPPDAAADRELITAGFTAHVVTSVRVGGAEALVVAARRDR